MFAWRFAPVAVLAVILSGCSQTSSAYPPLGGLPADPSMYVVGDSWSAGYEADPARTAPIVAAAALGWTVQSNAVSGTGYAHVFTPGTLTYLQRVDALPSGQKADVVLLQGSTNDEEVKASVLRRAVRSTISSVHSRFRGARVVMLGPGLYATSDAARLRTLDRVLAAVAEQEDVPYISMVRERWITASNIAAVIDAQTLHPTVIGDAYLGGRLSAALRSLQGRS